ncbi:c-type cytochrome [Arcobacter sp. s6]|jgi:cytochrome c2|uniref:c-type cytochrome n=1 Tax=Arcobacter sp. s6 TaxID=3230363 RepID=UPI0034A09190
MKIKLLILIISSNLYASSYGELLFNGNCVTCHSTNELNKSAPTIKEIQNIYKSAFPEKKDFIFYMSNWVLNPNKEMGLMDDSIKKYKLMPMLGYDRETLEEISAYLYDLKE